MTSDTFPAPAVDGARLSPRNAARQRARLERVGGRRERILATRRCAAGSRIASGVSWRQAHAVVAARPNVEWPAGLPVVTADTHACAGHDELQLIDIGSL